MAVEVSRRDIISDEIVELGSEARFLKLPIDPLYGAVECHSVTLADSNYQCG